MQVSVSEAKGQLTELVRRAESGEEVVLTRRGRPAVRLVAEQPQRPQLTYEEKMQLMKEIGERAAAKVLPGPCAARSADFLYDENGLPG